MDDETKKDVEWEGEVLPDFRVVLYADGGMTLLTRGTGKTDTVRVYELARAMAEAKRENAALASDVSALLSLGDSLHALAQHDESCGALRGGMGGCDCPRGRWAETARDMRREGPPGVRGLHARLIAALEEVEALTADNAALVAAINDWEDGNLDAEMRARVLVKQPHPGTTLLDELRTTKQTAQEYMDAVTRTRPDGEREIPGPDLVKANLEVFRDVHERANVAMGWLTQNCPTAAQHVLESIVFRRPMPSKEEQEGFAAGDRARNSAAGERVALAARLKEMRYATLTVAANRCQMYDDTANETTRLYGDAFAEAIRSLIGSPQRAETDLPKCNEPGCKLWVWNSAPFKVVDGMMVDTGPRVPMSNKCWYHHHGKQPPPASVAAASTAGVQHDWSPPEPMTGIRVCRAPGCGIRMSVSGMWQREGAGEPWRPATGVAGVPVPPCVGAPHAD